MWATIRSCSVGVVVTTSAPSARQKAVTAPTAQGGESASGVTKQGRPAKSSAVPCSQPVFSDPAMGWEPTK